jgi:hypothetical protein
MGQVEEPEELREERNTFYSVLYSQRSLDLPREICKGRFTPSQHAAIEKNTARREILCVISSCIAYPYKQEIQIENRHAEVVRVIKAVSAEHTRVALLSNGDVIGSISKQTFGFETTYAYNMKNGSYVIILGEGDDRKLIMPAPWVMEYITEDRLIPEWMENYLHVANHAAAIKDASIAIIGEALESRLIIEKGSPCLGLCVKVLALSGESVGEFVREEQALKAIGHTPKAVYSYESSRMRSSIKEELLHGIFDKLDFDAFPNPWALLDATRFPVFS